MSKMVRLTLVVLCVLAVPLYAQSRKNSSVSLIPE